MKARQTKYGKKIPGGPKLIPLICSLLKVAFTLRKGQIVLSVGCV